MSWNIFIHINPEKIRDLTTEIEDFRHGNSVKIQGKLNLKRRSPKNPLRRAKITKSSKKKTISKIRKRTESIREKSKARNHLGTLSRIGQKKGREKCGGLTLYCKNMKKYVGERSISCAYLSFSRWGHFPLSLFIIITRVWDTCNEPKFHIP